MEEKTIKRPVPMIDIREMQDLEKAEARYAKMTKPGFLSKAGEKAGKLVPQKVKDACQKFGENLSEQELYQKMMEVVGKGFVDIQEEVTKRTINEAQILAAVNKNLKGDQVDSIEELCRVRCYHITRAVNSIMLGEKGLAMAEGGGTGAIGLAGLPANLVLSMLLYFRAVQTIALFYGYDAKHDSAEMEIAREIFMTSMGSLSGNLDGEGVNLIMKFMAFGQAQAIRGAVKKGWTEMASRGGVALLLTQIRALANQAAAKALKNAGQKGLENVLLKESLEQVGKKLTQKSVNRMIPFISAFIGATLDTAQMSKTLKFADIFYQKRFLVEKEDRVRILLGEAEAMPTVADFAVDVDFQDADDQD